MDDNLAAKLFFLGCGCCCLVLNLGLGFGMVMTGNFVRRAEAWELQTAWRQTQCKVLAAGVSCTDDESRTTCGGYKAGVMPNQSVPVFLTEQIAVCPGTYWCAKEGDMCNCTGEITYSPELFDGYVYTVPEAEQAYKVKSDGMWKCGTDQSGVQYKVDPAPWHVKHCFCTPDGIQKILNPYGAENLHKKECSENANFDFEELPRRLSDMTLTTKDATQRARRLFQRLKQGSPKAALRQLHNSRRRRTYRYTPWALVTVEDSFDSETKPISCAYEFGVPQASGQIHQGDGPYKGDVWDAENVALDWGRDPVRPCWVRAQGQSASGFCALAMIAPGRLQEYAKTTQFVVSIMFWSCLGCSLVIFTLICVFFKTIVEMSKKKPATTSATGAEQQNLLSTEGNAPAANAPNASN